MNELRRFPAQDIDWRAPEVKRVPRSEKQKKEKPVEIDTIDDQSLSEVQRVEMRRMAKAVQKAQERAQPSEASVDQLEQQRLAELQQQLAEAERAVGDLPAWKRWAGELSSSSELARRRSEVTRLSTEVNQQTVLVRELSYVLPVEGLIATLHNEHPLENLRLQSGFREIRQALQMPDLFGNGLLPKDHKLREKALETLARMSESNNKVQAKWAKAGQRLLKAYATAYPSEQDRSNAMFAKQAAEIAEARKQDSFGEEEDQLAAK